MSWRNRCLWWGLLAAIVAFAQAPAPQPPGPAPNQPGAATPDNTGAPTLEDTVIVFKSRGDQAMARRDFDAAARFYRQYLDQAYHQDIVIDGLENLVRCLIYQGKIDEAAKLLSEVPARLAKLPTATPSFSPRNQLRYLYWQGRIDFLQGKLDDALKSFTAAAKPPADRALRSRALLGAAECKISREKWAEADALLRQVREEDLDEDQQWAAVVAQIRSHVMQGKYTEAEELIGRHWPTATGLYRIKIGMMHIVSLLGQDKVTEAFNFFREAFVKEPDYLNDPSHFAIIRGLGLALMKNKDYASASLVFERMLPFVHAEADKQTVILDQAEAADGAGDSAQAIRYLQLFINLYPADERLTTIRFRVAQLYEKLENYQEAITWYTQVYGSAGAAVDLRYRAAHRIAWISRDKLKNYANAILYFDESAKLDVSDDDKARAIYYAAETRALTEDYNDAAIHYGEVADNYPDSEFAKDARFKQGQCYHKSKRFSLAAEAYGQFIEKWGATDARKQEALLDKGLTERLAKLNPAAMSTLKQYADDYPGDLLKAPQALLRASEAASDADSPNQALQFLSRIIETYPNSEYYPYALYKRAYLHLSLGHHQEAVQDSLNFLSKYPESKLAPDVLLWLGDHFGTIQQFDAAETYFMTIVNKFPDSADAPDALYEAAKNAFRQRDFDKAIELLDKLSTAYPEAPDPIKAKAGFLHGDILSYRGEFTAAATLFDDCTKLPGIHNTRLYYASLGRLGECHYNLASGLDGEEKDQHLQLALGYFTQIIKELETGSDNRDSIVEKARYRKAKVHEMLKQNQQAKDEYYTIFYSYTDNEIRRRIFDWYYFARSGFDLAMLYKESSDFAAAIAIYRRLAKSTIPVASDAATLANELAEKYTPPADQPAPAPVPTPAPGAPAAPNN